MERAFVHRLAQIMGTVHVQEGDRQETCTPGYLLSEGQRARALGWPARTEVTDVYE